MNWIVFVEGFVCGLLAPMAVYGVLAAVAALGAAVRQRRAEWRRADLAELRRSVERAERGRLAP